MAKYNKDVNIWTSCDWQRTSAGHTKETERKVPSSKKKGKKISLKRKGKKI